MEVSGNCLISNNTEYPVTIKHMMSRYWIMHRACEGLILFSINETYFFAFAAVQVSYQKTKFFNSYCCCVVITSLNYSNL